jgi:DNA invertase Pin-like site-specific DNA recombinase
LNIGYARVSTDKQHNANQIEQLKRAGCEERNIYTDTASGGQWNRPKLQECLKHLRKDDVLVVWKLDRLSRSLGDLLRILKQLNEKDVGFRSLTEALDTTTSAGRLMMHMVGAFAEFEREIIKERTKAGLARARAKGRIGGRKQELSARRQAEVIRQVKSGEKQAAVAREQHVSKATICRIMKRAEAACG